MRTLAALWWGLALLLSVIGAARADAVERGLDDVIRAYRARVDQVRTIRIDTTSHLVPVIPEDDLFRELHVGPSLPNQLTVILHRDGRCYSEERDPASAVFPRVFEALAADFPAIRNDFNRYFEIPVPRVRDLVQQEWSRVPNAPPRLVVFDGRQLWEYEPELRLETEGVDRQAFTVVNPDTIGARCFPRSVLDDLLLTFPLAALPSEDKHHREYRLPDLFVDQSFVVTHESQSIDGVGCLVAEAAGIERIFFDPSRGYGVRKRQWFRDGELIYEVKGSDYEAVGDGLWLPRSAEYVQYGAKEQVGGKYLGKAVHRRIVTIEKHSLNEPEHLKYFSVQVPAGSWVIDQTLTPVDNKGQPVPFPEYPKNIVPAVTYLMPGAASEVDEAVRKARERAAHDVPGMPGLRAVKTTTLRTILIWIAIGLLSVTVAIVAYRRLSARG